jgi:hypothetical protein
MLLTKECFGKRHALVIISAYYPQTRSILLKANIGY